MMKLHGYILTEVGHIEQYRCVHMYKYIASSGNVRSATLPAVRAAAAMTGQSAFPFTITVTQEWPHGQPQGRTLVNSWDATTRHRLEGTCGAVGVEAEVLPCCRWIRLRTGWERIAGEVDLRRILEHDQTLKQMRADIGGTHADGMSVCLHPRAHKWPSRGMAWRWRPRLFAGLAHRLSNQRADAWQ